MKSNFSSRKVKCPNTFGFYAYIIFSSSQFILHLIWGYFHAVKVQFDYNAEKRLQAIRNRAQSNREGGGGLGGILRPPAPNGNNLGGIGIGLEEAERKESVPLDIHGGDAPVPFHARERSDTMLEYYRFLEAQGINGNNFPSPL